VLALTRPLTAALAAVCVAVAATGCGSGSGDPAPVATVGPATMAAVTVPVPPAAPSIPAPATTTTVTGPTAATTTTTVTTKPATDQDPQPAGQGEAAQRSRTTGSADAGTTDPKAQTSCGRAAKGFVNKILTNGDCPTAKSVATRWVKAVSSGGQDPTKTITVTADAPYVCTAQFAGEQATVLCQRNGNPHQARVVFLSHP
jgi:hypothetical protein